MTTEIRPAREADVPLVLRFIRELAEYERLLHAVTNTEADIHALLFGAPPAAFCDIAELDGKPVGFAFWFYNVSTFRGRGIHLEDLYVDPAARGAGVGKALLARLAKRCVDEKLVRLEWQVLDWNAPAIAFYDSLLAETKSEWITRRLTGEALEKMAAGAT